MPKKISRIIEWHVEMCEDFIGQIQSHEDLVGCQMWQVFISIFEGDWKDEYFFDSELRPTYPAHVQSPKIGSATARDPSVSFIFFHPLPPPHFSISGSECPLSIYFFFHQSTETTPRKSWTSRHINRTSFYYLKLVFFSPFRVRVPECVNLRASPRSHDSYTGKEMEWFEALGQHKILYVPIRRNSRI